MRSWPLALIVAGALGCDSGSSSSADAGTGDGTGSSTGSLACGGTPGATGVINGTIDVAGTNRTYILVVPATYDVTRAYPLVFAWHGRTGSAAGARSYFGMEAQAGDDAILVYPQGLDVSSTPGDTGWELTATGRDVALFDALQADLASRYCVGRTYSMGHSFGGFMSNALACFRGGTDAGDVRAIASIAGGGPFGACSGGALSAVIIHGSADSIVPFSQGEASRDTWRTKAGCATSEAASTPSPCVAYDSCTAGVAVRWCPHASTTSGGHGWPSFAAPAAWQLFTESP
jgi:polyhydroxybutyrate depolymerase